MYVLDTGSGTPIVLLHGFSVDHRLLLPLGPTIDAVGGWRRLHLDLPGHGRTPIGAVAGARDVVAAVEAEIEARLGHEPFAVVGSSFGGMVARQLAHDLPERVLGLALLAPVVIAESAARDVPERVVLARDDVLVASLGEAAEAFEEVAVVHTREAADAFLAHVWPGLTSGDPIGQAAIAANYALPVEPEEDTPAFDRPTLVVTGRQDDVVGHRDQLALIEQYPRATYAVLDGAGHNVHLDRPEAVAVLLADWLRALQPIG